jgi:hypothetical protein
MAPRSNQAAIMRDALGNRLCSAAFSISGDVDAVQVRVSFRMGDIRQLIGSITSDKLHLTFDRAKA